MSVYLDAVFYPNIYNEEKIFRQEGWSYNLESEEDALTYNGVVYNEMKGAFSSPESVLDRVVLNTLFPDTSYANESGGDPEVIPELTYEQFLDFHRTYYHPSNSYIYLYGDMDMEEKLLGQKIIEAIELGKQMFGSAAGLARQYGGGLKEEVYIGRWAKGENSPQVAKIEKLLAAVGAELVVDIVVMDHQAGV